MRKVRLRTKFLLSLVAITAGLSSATLLIVSYSVQKRVRENIRGRPAQFRGHLPEFCATTRGHVAALRATAGRSSQCTRHDDHTGLRDDSGRVRGCMEPEWERFDGIRKSLGRRGGDAREEYELRTQLGARIHATVSAERRASRLVVWRRPPLRSVDSADLFWRGIEGIGAWLSGGGTRNR